MDSVVYKFQTAIVFIVLFLIHFSFTSLSYIATLTCEWLILTVFLLGITFLKNRRSINFDFLNNLFFRSLCFLMIWLSIQMAGAWMALPGWPIAGNWNQWFSFYLQLLAACLLALLVENILKNRKTFEQFLTGFILLQASFAVFFLCLLFISRGRVENLILPWAFWPYLGKWSASVVQPNNLVDLWMPGIFLGLGMSFYRIEKKIREGFFSFDLSLIRDAFCVFMMLFALFMTESRGGILAFGAGGAAFVFCMMLGKGNRIFRTALLLIFLIAAVAGLFLIGIEKSQQALATLSHMSSDSSANFRKLVMQYSLDLISQQGLWGVGLGQFHYGWIWFCSKPAGEFPVRSYNDFLWFWAEGGFPAIFFFVFALITLSKSLLTVIWKTESRLVGALAAAIFSSSIGLIAHSMIDPTFYVASLLWLFFIGLGMAGALLRMEIEETQEPIFPAEKRNFFFKSAWIALSCFMLLFCSGKLAAIVATHLDQAPESLEKAMRLDPLNAEYPAKLSSYEEKEYDRTKQEKHLIRAQKLMGTSIHKDIFFLSRTAKWADLLRKTKDLEGVDEAFSNLTTKLEGFYLADMTASTYWMSLAQRFSKEKSQEREAYAKRKSLLYYEAALKAYPEMNLFTVLWGLGNAQSNEYYMQVIKPKESSIND